MYFKPQLDLHYDINWLSFFILTPWTSQVDFKVNRVGDLPSSYKVHLVSCSVLPPGQITQGWKPRFLIKDSLTSLAMVQISLRVYFYHCRRRLGNKEMRENRMKETLRFQVGKKLSCHPDKRWSATGVPKNHLWRLLNITVLRPYPRTGLSRQNSGIYQWF